MLRRDSRYGVVVLVALATFADLVAYSICVPVLPDIARRLGAGPATIGLLFASFGVTLLVVPVPAGWLSDRFGRRGPLVAGLVALAAASVAFGVGTSLAWLFTARLIQGAADAVTWVVGFALIADAYDRSERGRMTGIVMASSSFAYMLGPSLGGWLYDVGGGRLPFFALAALALASAVAFAFADLPARQQTRDRVPLTAIVGTPAVAACAAAVVAIGATLAMLEPAMALELESNVGLTPAQVGLVFVPAAIANMGLHPLFGRLADRWGARRLTIAGLFLTAAALPAVGRMSSLPSAAVLLLLETAAVAVVLTPSLAYMADAVSSVGLGTFGVAYGLYNMAWGVGLLGGPAAGGWLFERAGFSRLTLAWAVAVGLVAAALTRVQSQRSPPEEPV